MLLFLLLLLLLLLVIVVVVVAVVVVVIVVFWEDYSISGHEERKIGKSLGSLLRITDDIGGSLLT